MNKKNIENPLTIEQLREMVGMPVLVQCLNPGKYVSPPAGWRILEKSITGHFGVWDGDNCLVECDYGTDWLAYAYPPAHIDREAWTSEWLYDADTDTYYCANCRHTICASNYFGNKLPPYCEMCGKAMTEEAWDELGKRMRG